MTLIPAHNRYDTVIIHLLSNKLFQESPEFELIRGFAGDLPGVVAAAYGNFVARLISSGNSDAVTMSFDLINQMAEWKDGSVNQLISCEIFESDLSELDPAILKEYAGSELMNLITDLL